ncbi:hypothetical protein BC938DRAFT_476607, partial [Jimgerdemannia flammicorona]
MLGEKSLLRLIKRVQAREATLQELLSVHAETHVRNYCCPPSVDGKDPLFIANNRSITIDASNPTPATTTKDSELSTPLSDNNMSIETPSAPTATPPSASYISHHQYQPEQHQLEQQQQQQPPQPQPEQQSHSEQDVLDTVTMVNAPAPPLPPPPPPQRPLPERRMTSIAALLNHDEPEPVLTQEPAVAQEPALVQGLALVQGPELIQELVLMREPTLLQKHGLEFVQGRGPLTMMQEEGGDADADADGDRMMEMEHMEGRPQLNRSISGGVALNHLQLQRQRLASGGVAMLPPSPAPSPSPSPQQQYVPADVGAAISPPALQSRMTCGELGIAIDTTFHPSQSPIAARVSAGSLLNLVDEVVTGRVRNGFALIRPPGHHAEDDEAMGFCFFNNVAVATALALQKYPSTIGKVLIID